MHSSATELKTHANLQCTLQPLQISPQLRRIASKAEAAAECSTKAATTALLAHSGSNTGGSKRVYKLQLRQLQVNTIQLQWLLQGFRCLSQFSLPFC